jgi:integrase
VVVIPAAIRPDLTRHLSAFTGPADDALVFTSPTGAQLHRGNFRRRCWAPALARVGMTDIHFHDLRHTGNALTAATGATLRELMDRMGHSSPRAALIYLHGSDVRQQAIADDLSELAGPELQKGKRRPSGRGALGRSGT